MSSKAEFPKWFQMVCCGVPMTALIAISVGLAGGVTVSPVVTFTIAALVWRVISKVLGIEQPLVSLTLPSKANQLTVLNDKTTSDA